MEDTIRDKVRSTLTIPFSLRVISQLTTLDTDNSCLLPLNPHNPQ
jgi:hypothetical protein